MRTCDNIKHGDIERQLATACKLTISAQTERDEAWRKLESVRHKAQQIANGETNPMQRARAIMQVCDAVVG